MDHIPYPIEDLQLQISIRQQDGTLVALTPRQNLFPAWHADTAEFALSVADDAITSSKIRDGSVESRDILDGTIANSDLANNSLTSGKIQDGQVTTADIADRSITREDIALNSIGHGEIGDTAIKKRHLDTSANEINLATIPDQITGGQVQDGSIKYDNLAGGGNLGDGGYLQRFGSYSASLSDTSDSNRAIMIAADGTSACFLSKVEVEDVDAGRERAACFVTTESGYWTLIAQLRQTDDANVWCSAFCIDWK